MKLARVNSTRRKIPRQDRSRNTVRRILQAAIDILGERGYDGASTNRIASVAGISPGSLYQYFPNKDAIVDAVVSDYGQQLLERVTLRLSELLQSETDALIPSAIEAQVDAMLEQPEILRMISTQLPGQTTTDLLKPMEALMAATIKGYAAGHTLKDVDMNLDAASWVIAHLLGATVRYVVDEPPIAKDVYVAEMTRLVQSHPIAWVCMPASTHVNSSAPRAIGCATSSLGRDRVGNGQQAGIWDGPTEGDRGPLPLASAG